jgi:hypothetical protein
MKYKICLLGTENAQNTKLLVMEMHGKGIKFSIALQKQNTIIAFEKSTYRYVTTYISEILKKSIMDR